MTPNPSNITGVLDETDLEINVGNLKKEKASKRKFHYVWFNMSVYVYIHLTALYGLYLLPTAAKYQTILLGIVMLNLGSLGITCGAHRLWSHRAYKVNLPLNFMLLVMQTIAVQNSAMKWARDHRFHHKYTETDADPYNANRGLFYSHMGWLMVKKQPEYFEKQKTIDISDLTSDPLLRFQKKYFKYCVLFVSFFLPTVIPMIFWNETFVTAFCLNMFRYCSNLHITWAVNSFAHYAGNKPYDRTFFATENFVVSMLAFGEGWHNYHHAFPWDYKAAEFGKYSTNISTAFIDFMAKIGWAYDLKTVSEEVIKKRVMRTGDGSHEIWGWGDKDMPKEDKNEAVIINKKKP